MKKLLFLLSTLICFSCLDKNFILNSEQNPRPTANRVFKIDRKNKTVGDLSIIDTNAVYICNEIIRAKNEVKTVYYRFFSNGNLQEVSLRNEDIESTINNPNIGNVGRYKVLKDTKIKLEVLRSYPLHDGQLTVQTYVEFGEIKNGNLYLLPNHFTSNQKWIYQGGGGGGLGILPVALVDMMIPDNKNCFKKTKMASLKPMSLNF